MVGDELPLTAMTTATTTTMKMRTTAGTHRARYREDLARGTRVKLHDHAREQSSVGRYAHGMETAREQGRVAQVKAELLAREPVFHKPQFGMSREALLMQTAEDFWEVGASGAVYEREHVIEEVARRGKVAGDEDWVMDEIRLRELCVDTFALTYRLDQAGRLTRRVTLWRQDRGEWRVLYHQGTVVSERRLTRAQAS